MQCQAMLGSLLKADNILKLSSSFAYSENWGQKQRFLSAASSKEQSWVFSSSYSVQNRNDWSSIPLVSFGGLTGRGGEGFNIFY